MKEELDLLIGARLPAGKPLAAEMPDPADRKHRAADAPRGHLGSSGKIAMPAVVIIVIVAQVVEILLKGFGGSVSEVAAHRDQRPGDHQRQCGFAVCISVHLLIA